LPEQIQLFVNEYQQLCEQRDFAAYRALGAITAAICFCRNHQTQDALGVLTSAIQRYEQADEKLQQLKLAAKGEN
jgi:hypothetical protein